MKGGVGEDERLVRTLNDSLEDVVDAWLKAKGGGERCVLTE